MRKNLPKILLIFVLAVVLKSCVTVAPNIEKGIRDTPEGYATEPAIPLGVVTNETTAQQLQFAHNQGQAAEKALQYLIENSAGAEMSAGPYQIGYFVEQPKSWYQVQNGKDDFYEADGNIFLSVAVRDGYDGRIVPGLEVKGKILTSDSVVVNEKTLDYGIHPLLNRYGANFRVPEEGNYIVKIEVEPAKFWRHDPVNGDRYTDKTIAVFDQKEISPYDLKEPENPEKTKEWMPLAKAQGRAIKRAVDAMISKTAMDGEQIEYGPYLLTYAVEYAEGYWRYKNDKLLYKIKVENSAEKNAHIEVAVFDALTGRMIPGFEVEATFLKANEQITSVVPTLMWHPWLYHYGNNFRVPKKGKYELRVKTSPNHIKRYGAEFGEKYGGDIEYLFTDVDVRTGQK